MTGNILSYNGTDVPGTDEVGTVWILFCGCLTMIMTPGAAFAYGGLRQKKHVLTISMQCFIAMALGSIAWVAVGFSLAFGESMGGFIGDPRTFFLFKDVGSAPHAGISPGVPLIVTAFFSMMFAALTPALISGAWDGRVNFFVFCVCLVPWLVLVYCPVAHWVWHPDGWLSNWGVLDWAGGTAVHITSGWSALISRIFLVGDGATACSCMRARADGSGDAEGDVEGGAEGGVAGESDAAANALPATQSDSRCCQFAYDGSRPLLAVLLLLLRVRVLDAFIGH